MFGDNKNNNDQYGNYNGYTDYNNNGYGGYDAGNYGSYGDNNANQGYEQNYQSNYQEGYQDYQNNTGYQEQNNYQNDYNNYNSFDNTGYFETQQLQDTSNLNLPAPYDNKVQFNDYQQTSYIEPIDNNMYNQQDDFGGQVMDTQSFNIPEQQFGGMQDQMFTGMEPESPQNDFYDDGLDGGVSAIMPNKSHAMLGTVVSLGAVAIIGIVCGKLSQDLFADFWNRNIYSKSVLEEGAKVLGIILFAYVISIVHIILHELGHLIGGRMTQYSAVTFRIFSLTFVKDGKRTRIKKFDVPGTAGECIMMPPESNNGNYPYMLYNLGGIIMNLLASMGALAAYFKIGACGRYPGSMLSVVFAIIGLITILYNGIPLIINGVPNDGYTLMHMLKSADARQAVHANLLISAYLSRGGRYSEIPYEQFYINSQGEYGGHLAVKVKLKEYRWHLEHMDFFKAAECLNSMDYCFRKLPRIFQYEINSEKMFLEIIGKNDPAIVEKLYNADIKKYLADTQGIMSTSRTMMAYEACVTHNMKAANKQYIALKNGAKTEPLKGEVELELMLGQYIYESFCANTFSA